MNKKVLIFTTVLSAIILIAGCKKEDKDETPATYTVTQSDLNKAATAEDLGVSGTPFGQDVSIPHNGSTMSPDSTIRDIYSNLNRAATIEMGTIFTKHTFLMNEDGSKGDLQVTFAMVKREAGYNPEGGDFEYIMMPNDGSIDYGVNPNGELPDVSQTDMRGKLAMCASCHSKSSSYVFVHQ
ncbi:MAG: hypothetical protein V2I62_09910 [Bacteroidales bacterium]|jgi:hypothetical protein|nr:hypothetical protein [Bacteroidales bacterium]